MPAVARIGEFYDDKPKPQKRAFQVSPIYQSILTKRKRSIARRLIPGKPLQDLGGPELCATNIHYEMADKASGHSCGGVGIVHQMVNKLGLADIIDSNLKLLVIHKPYHESDHVLSITYNILAGGSRLEDLELRRKDEAFMDSLGARRLPDPTTAGDFMRRFDAKDVVILQECINVARRRVWQEHQRRNPAFLARAFIDVDGTIAGTLGECKGGMNISYKGIWGYHPLLVTLANTREVLYCVNRPGNVASHEGNAEWVDRAIKLVQPYAAQITLRGDTDFTNSAHLDRWDEEGVKFIFGMDAHAKAVGMAEGLPESAWEALIRPAKYEVATQTRERPENVKEQVVIAKGYTNQKLRGECVAEFDYRPCKCAKTYRMIALRKNISVMKGEEALVDQIRYFFYITNITDERPKQIVGLANDRCDQENIIEQAKNGVNAMRMPVNDLVSNGAYMVMALLAWNLKAWYGLMMPNRKVAEDVMGMEMRRFLQQFVWLPVQIVQAGRRIIFRMLSYNDTLGALFRFWERLRRWRPAWV
jgi:Transposase DDE domain group 1